jgi:hypothetical protein
LADCCTCSVTINDGCWITAVVGLRKENCCGTCTKGNAKKWPGRRSENGSLYKKFRDAAIVYKKPGRRNITATLMIYGRFMVYLFLSCEEFL